MENDSKVGGGWKVGRFVAVELDVALSLTTGYFIVSGFDEEFGALVQPIADDWKADARDILGPEPRIVSLMETATLATGTTFEEDYARAFLPVRSLDPVGALETLGAAKPAPDSDRSESVRFLTDALVERQLSAYRLAGLEIEEAGPQVASTRAEGFRLGRILAGGDLHDRFWPWLDRYFYEWYQPWRRSREHLMAEAEQRVTLSLGGSSSAGGRPRLDWLPPQNPVRTKSELRTAIEERGIPVYFWVEPFGFADLSIIRNDAICISFGEPGRIYAEFLEHAARVAQRAKALGDPTRLTILRLIRHFSAMNTELADYLGIARPTVSIHAKVLRDAGLITSRQQGHAVRHEINRNEIRKLFEDLYRFLDLGSFDRAPVAPERTGDEPPGNEGEA